MVIYFPVCQKDAALAARSVARMAALADCSPEHVYMVGEPEIAGPLTEILREAGIPASTMPLSVPDLPWPAGANRAFLACAAHADKAEGSPPWLWLEPDAFPTHNRWFAALVEEYGSCGKPFMGVSEKTRFVDPVTGVEVIHTIEVHHIAGVAIYPAHFLRMSSLLKFVPDKTPFDVYVQHEIYPLAHQTNKIIHQWGTCEYHWAAGRIYSRAAHPNGRPGVIRKEDLAKASIVHGCKDMSLVDLLDGKQDAEPVKRPRRKPESSERDALPPPLGTLKGQKMAYAFFSPDDFLGASRTLGPRALARKFRLDPEDLPDIFAAVKVYVEATRKETPDYADD